MSNASGNTGKPAAALASWWQGLAARERRLVMLAALVLGAYGIWALALAPALRTLARAPVEREALELQLQAMQRQAAEAQQLRAVPPVNAELAAAALRAATGRLGDRGRLNLQGERATLTLNGVGTQALRNWLAEARSGARARPVEAKLTRGEAGYSGTLVLAIGSAS